MPIRAGSIRWQEVIDLAYDAILVRSVDDTILQWSAGAERMYGILRSEALGRSSQALLHTRFPVPAEQIRETVDRNGYWQGIVEHQARDGRRLLVESRWTAVRGRNDRLRAFFEINRDLSERQQLVEERAARSEAEALTRDLLRQQREREIFLAVLGHDLRNPLGAIRLGADAIARHRDVPEEVSHNAERMARSCERMQRLIDQILDFARARYGQGIPIDRHPVDVHEICREVISDFELRGNAGRIELITEGAGVGNWDHDRLFQVLQNLVHNGLKFARVGTRVAVRVRPSDPGVTELTVHNDGEPISPDVLPVLFDAFRQSSTTGLGLGLYIAQKIVSAHGGELYVESRPGEGTTFRVRLPGALS
jgi:PAS domain S-box-containing protein